MDILEFAIPNTWKNQATLQGFDSIAHMPSEFVDFCKHLELIEDIEEESPKSRSSEKHSSSSRSSKYKCSTKKHKVAEVLSSTRFGRSRFYAL